MPRVTVIVPTYNWATVLPYSIGSVLDQTFRDFELLVIGDGCTDESGDVVGSIDDLRVHWHNLDVGTRHQTGPNNEGLRRASGEIIAYLGHDDIWLPHHLELLVAAMDDGAPWATASLLSIEPSGRPTLWPQGTPRLQWLSPSSVVHPCDLVVELGGWRLPTETGAVAPQTDMWERIAAAVGPPRHVPRLTSVKIPAGSRRDVYRERPCHEQAYWLARIRESDDPEQLILRAAQEDYVFARDDQPCALPPVDDPRGMRGVARRMRSRLAGRGLVSAPGPVSAAEYLRQVRKFKGVDD